MSRVKKIPGGVDSSIYNTFKYISYAQWSAIAEFVDNSVDSYLKNRSTLDKINKKKPNEPGVKISIDYNKEELIIRDNAAGISDNEINRAFRTGIPPKNVDGLSEFGMGMKTAACWFGDFWTVETSAIDEGTIKNVKFDVDEIVKSKKDNFDLIETKGKKLNHYTVLKITLRANRVNKGGKSVEKIKKCIGHKYRIFIRNNTVEIKFNNQILEYTDYDTMVAPPYKGINIQEKSKLYGKQQKQTKHKWEYKLKKIDLGNKVTVDGTVRLIDPMKRKYAGFSIFRRKRLIEGGFEDTWRPDKIFGASNTHQYARICGELHIKGAKVSHDKTKIDWDTGQKELLVSEIHKQLNHPDILFIQQATNYRKDQEKKPSDLVEVFPDDSPIIIDVEDIDDVKPEPKPNPNSKKFIGPREITIIDGDKEWKVKIQHTSEPSYKDLITLSNRDENNGIIEITVSQSCDFFHQYGTSREVYDLTLKMVAAIVTSVCIVEHRNYRDKYQASRAISIVNQLTNNLKMH